MISFSANRSHTTNGSVSGTLPRVHRPANADHQIYRQFRNSPITFSWHSICICVPGHKGDQPYAVCQSQAGRQHSIQHSASPGNT
jgi:hypothetical protein